MMTMNDQGTNKKTRRMVIVLCLVALSFYVTFILMTAFLR